MLENLKHTGTVFDYSADDQNFINDLLEADVGEGLQVVEHAEPSSDKTFEDEE